MSFPLTAVTSSIIVYGGKGKGKRLALDTPLATPSGWTTMGEIKVGDELFDENGKRCRVTVVSPIVDGDSYRITFSDGSTIDADAEHLWVTENYRERRKGLPGQIRTTLEIRKTLTRTQGQQVANCHSIRNTAPLELPDRILPVDPYVLGLWLGDGSSAAGVITIGEQDEEETVGLLRAAGCEVHSHRVVERAPMYGVYGLKVKLRALGVLGDKHVPLMYLRASSAQRLSLLQGLLDSDGTLNGESVEFDNTNKKLIDAVHELVVSLGMRASITERRSVLYGVDHGPSWRLFFTPTLPVFRLSRKAEKLRFDRAQALRRLRRYITSVEPIESVPMRCIAVDSPNHLYLAGRQMVPTHNTNFGAVFAEELHACHLRFACIDPMGVWWGLRHSIDGKKPGIEVLILGGLHGDIPIEPTAGAVVADLVADESVSVIIDISRRADGKMWSIGERIRFVADYCERLYQRQGEKRRPLMQIIDEAARFAPQMVRHGEAYVARCSGAVAVMVEEGRNVGIGVCLITQRSARLNKDVAELADCMISFCVVGPNSMGAILEWLGEHVEKSRHKEIAEKLRKLPIGTALVISPAWLEFEGIVPMRARTTFDSSATPKPGQKSIRASGGKKLDLTKYEARMADAILKAMQDDPKLLRDEITKLKKEMAEMAKKRVVSKTKTIREEHYVFRAGEVKRLEKLGVKIVDSIRQLDAAISVDLIGRMEKALSVVKSVSETGLNVYKSRESDALDVPIKFSEKSWIEKPKGVGALIPGAPSNGRSPNVTFRPTPVAVRTVIPGSTPGTIIVADALSVIDPSDGAKIALKDKQVAILRALKLMLQLGQAWVSRKHIAALSGQSPKSSAYSEHVSLLTRCGLTESRDGSLSILAEGQRLIGTVPDDGTDLLDAYKRHVLNPAQGRIVDALRASVNEDGLGIEGNPISKEVLAKRAGASHKSSAYMENLSDMRALALIDYAQGGVYLKVT